VTLVNWTNRPLAELSVTVRVPFVPKTIRSVAAQRNLAGATFADGAVTFSTSLADADYVLLLK
jgi:hypothetical protein